MARGSKRSGKRPWLAALLGTLATGLGHFYLRRWGRGLGWFAAAIAASVLLVPPEAARALLAGTGADLRTLAPLLAVGVASVADAYVLARLSQRAAGTRADDGATAASAPPPDADGGARAATDAGGEGGSAAGKLPAEGAECPDCGKGLDPDLDFCPWCTARLEREDA